MSLPADSTNDPIVHDPTRHNFSANNGSVLDYVPQPPGAIDIVHVEVPIALRGKGIAPRLMDAALSYADTHHLRVIATCPYAALYMKRLGRLTD